MAVNGGHARRRCEEVTVASDRSGGREEGGIGKEREHAIGLVALDEADSTHVAGQIEVSLHTIAGGLACFTTAKVELSIVDVIESLKPVVERLDVDGTNSTPLIRAKPGHQVSTDEA